MQHHAVSDNVSMNTDSWFCILDTCMCIHSHEKKTIQSIWSILQAFHEKTIYLYINSICNKRSVDSSMTESLIS